MTDYPLYHAMLIEVDNHIVGRIRSWETPHREQEPRIGPIGNPYQAIPGERINGIFPYVHLEVFPEEVEQAVGQIGIFGIYDLLTDPRKTFSVIENRNSRRWRYTECWVEYPKSIEVSADKSTIEIHSPMRYNWVGEIPKKIKHR